MQNLKNVKCLTVSAALLALAAILGMFKIPVTQLIEIRFGALPVAIAGSMFGPVVGAAVGGLADIVQFIVKPTGPYFPGFTISSAISGVIFGLVLKRKEGKVNLLRIFIAMAAYTVIVGMFINSLNLYILFGKMEAQGWAGFWAYFVTRLPKELIMYPINCVLLIAVMKAIEPLKRYFDLGYENRE